MALAERWSSIIQTFHLLVGEIKVLLIDFYMMTRLSINGTPPLSLEDFDADVVALYIGPQPMVYYKGTKGVLQSWFKNDYVWAMDASTVAEKAFFTQAFLLYMLTYSIFCGKINRV